MTFELWMLFLAGVAYLLVLFLIAYAGERGFIPRAVARHPATYALSLGVYATSWTYYGSVGFAQSEGYGFLTIYLGVTLAFALTPVLLMPILRLTHEFQLTSLADLFAFRYRHQATGVLVTVFMLIGILPYVSLQILAVTESIRALTRSSTPSLLAFGFCLILIVFAILFGARHASAREKHEGLVVAIAFESAVKLLAFAAAGMYAAFGLLGPGGGLAGWLERHPEALERLYAPVSQGPWTTLMLLAFAASFLLPRQFHMTFTENIEPRTLATASWGFPLFLFALNLPVVPLVLAGAAFAPGTSPDYRVLGITLHSGSAWLPTIVFLGGMSAASAMMIVETLALAAMCLNHLVLPLSFPGRAPPHANFYERLLWTRRVLIALLILAGYGFYLLLRANQELVQLGLVSFVAVAQFLPGILGLLYWPRATRSGFIAGLLGGGLLWALTLLVPLLEHSGISHTGINVQAWLGASGQDPIAFGTFWSLAVNGVLFVTLSILTRASAEEQEAARACTRGTLPPLGVVAAASPQQFTEQLTPIVGSHTAEREVQRALADLRMDLAERRPPQLRRLRERIERNLSGLVGPLLARMVVNDRLQLETRSGAALTDTVRALEEHLEDSRLRLRGLAAELDQLRRYHRRILQELPLAVCASGPGGEIAIWNHAMERLSGLPSVDVGGVALGRLPDPWGALLHGFAAAREQHLYKVQVRVRARARWLTLHKAAIAEPAAPGRGGTVILIEDLTERQTLESELAHAERLASIGRLAAGVAHEIGNPLTGIDSLAQILHEETDPAVIRESIDLIQSQTRRIADIVQSLVTFAHSGSPADQPREPVGIAGCVEEAARLVSLSRAAKRIAFTSHCRPELRVAGERNRLVQMFVNLLTNACDASRPGGAVEVRCSPAAESVAIEVIDHGVGIPTELRDRVFEPFFTTKSPGEGTGLGLAVVYNIVSDCGGNIAIDSTVGTGTCVHVRLPLARGAVVAEGTKASAA